MLVQVGLCRTCSETTLLVFPRGGSYNRISSWHYCFKSMVSRTIDEPIIGPVNAYPRPSCHFFPCFHVCLCFQNRPLPTLITYLHLLYHSWGTKERFWLTLAPVNNTAKFYMVYMEYLKPLYRNNDRLA